jgi:hypothetical protein
MVSGPFSFGIGPFCLSNGFSKKIDNHVAAVALYDAKTGSKPMWLLFVKATFRCLGKTERDHDNPE